MVVVLAKALLIVFLVIATATFVITYMRRRRDRDSRPSWPPTESVYRTHVATLLPWVDEYGQVIDPDEEDGDKDGQRPQAGHA